MFYGIFFGISILSVLAMVLFKVHKNENPIVTKIAKIAVVVFMALYFVNLFLPDAYAMRTYDDRTLYLNGEHTWFIILRWLNDLAFLVLPIAIFFKKDLFNKIAGYFLLIVCLVNVGIYFKYMEAYTSPNGAGIMALRFFSPEVQAFFINPVFRSLYFGVYMFVELMIICFIILRSYKTYKINKDVKSVLINLGIFVLLLCAIMPIYVPQYLFNGYSLTTEKTLATFKMGSFFHIAWIIFVIIEGVVLTLLFKKKSYEDRFIVVLVLGLSLVAQYNQMFTGIGEITAHRMPFQLCNMAGLFILLMLLTKSEKIYHFTLVINSVGAIIAMAMCDTTPYGVTYIMNIHYIAEHTNVILAPILCATLGLFPKLENKHIKDFLVGFAIYFLFILVVGGTFMGLKETTGNDYWNCNYLFMLNKAETMNIVGFVGPLFDIKVVIGGFFTLSLVQLMVFVVFSGICTGAFFLIKALMNLKKKTEDVKTDEAVN